MRYSYVAVDPSGASKKGEVDAASEAQALAELARRQLVPVSLHPAPPEKATRQRARRRGDASGRVALVLLVRELATLLRAGVTLEESLRTLTESRRGLPLETPLKAVLASVLTGQRFSQALAGQVGPQGLALPPYVIALVAAGESTGDLAAALGRAAEQLEFDEQLRAETSEALVYPAILLTAGAASVLFVFSFVVPRFSALLANRKVDLPWLSSVVLGIGMFVNQHWGWLLVVLGALALMGFAGWRAVGPARARSAISHVPLIGTWVLHQELSRWTGMLALMLQSRVPILTALDLTANAVTLPDIARRLRLTVGDIGRGEAMSRSFERQELLPPTALSMVRVGERSGQLASMMSHVAGHALEQNRRQRRRLVALIEPAAIVVLGGIIALVIVGVVLALTSLSDVKF